MDAIVLAGGILVPKDPLYPVNPGGYKALITISGKVMVQWVLDSLEKSPSIERIVLVGLPDSAQVSCKLKPFSRVTNTGDMLENIQSGIAELVKQDPCKRRVLIVSSDVPAITPEMVEWEIQMADGSEHDLYYNVIQRKIMEEQFPSSKRSFYPLKDMEVCGADVNAVDTDFALNPPLQAQKIIKERKNLYNQAAVVGFDTMALFLFKRLSLEEAECLLSKKLNMKARAMICPFAEMGMDVDKPYQLEQVREHLEKRELL